jgi:hypothetical protein
LILRSQIPQRLEIDYPPWRRGANQFPLVIDSLVKAKILVKDFPSSIRFL